MLGLERGVIAKRTGGVRRARAEAVTALAPTRAGAAALLRLGRGHWSIATTRPWVRAVTFDEDQAGVGAGHAPPVMAALRTTAIGLLRCLGATTSAAATRRFAAQPALALAAVGLPIDNA